MSPVWVLFAVLVFQSGNVWGDDISDQLTNLLSTYKKQALKVKNEIDDVIETDLSDLTNISKNLEKLDELQDKLDTLKSTLNKVKSLTDLVPETAKNLMNEGLGMVSSLFK